MTHLLAFQPSYWQRLAAAVVVIAAVLPVLVLLVEGVRRHVTVPRAAGRRWPEGLGRWSVGELPAELVSAVQTEDLLPPGAVRSLADLALAGGVAAACASLVALPIDTDIAAVRPAAGAALLPISVLVWAFADLLGAVALADPDELDAARRRGARRLAAVVALALAALAVAAQAGSGSLTQILSWQVHHALFGHPGAGLPFAVAQAPALGASLLALHALATSDDGPARPVGGLRRVAIGSADTAVLVAGAAWVAVAFLGGGAVPWRISDVAVRTVFAVALFGMKVVLVLGVVLWSVGRWPRVAFERALAVLVGAALVAGLDVGATVALRAWF